MMNNNLSNKQAPYVMFDIDSLMYLPKEPRPLDKVWNIFKTEEKIKTEREVNPIFTRTLQRVWDNNNVCIGLFTTEMISETEAIEKTLDEEFVPYTRLFKFPEWEELRYFNQSIYTFSSNAELISYLSRNDAMFMDDIWEVLK